MNVCMICGAPDDGAEGPKCAICNREMCQRCVYKDTEFCGDCVRSNQYPRMPEGDKAHKHHEDMQTIGAFLEMSALLSKVCEFHEDYKVEIIDAPEGNGEEIGLDVEGLWLPKHHTINQVLAEHFDIDMDKLDEEKRLLLSLIRARAELDAEEGGDRVTAVNA